MKCTNIHEKNKQLTLSDRNLLLGCLERDLNLTDTGKFLHCSTSTVKREIDKHKTLKVCGKNKSQCGNKVECNLTHLCGNSKCTRSCKDCHSLGRTCNDFCDYFTPIPNCKQLKKHCGVCNGCPNFKQCGLNKLIYEPSRAQLEYRNSITTPHMGISISNEEALALADFLIPKLKKNLSISVLKSLYPEMLPMSVQTIYSWVDNGFLPGIDNILLPRKVKYKPRKVKIEQNNTYEYLQGRFYEDFIAFTNNHRELIDIVEMDTVEGCNHDSYILTLLFRKSNFMLSFKLKDHSSNSVVKVFNYIKESIGENTFSRYFKVILTDRGCEFKDPLAIETSSSGKKLINIFYCDSRQSQQKGKIEKNHEELRKIFPKGTSFSNVSQEKLNVAINMVNSYPRESLNFSSPYDLFSIYGDPLILALNDCKRIYSDKLNLSPRAIK